MIATTTSSSIRVNPSSLRRCRVLLPLHGVPRTSDLSAFPGDRRPPIGGFAAPRSGDSFRLGVVETEALEQRVASLEQRLGETFDLLRTLVSLVSQINVESYLGTMDGAPPDERRRVYEDIRHEL